MRDLTPAERGETRRLRLHRDYCDRAGDREGVNWADRQLAAIFARVAS